MDTTLITLRGNSASGKSTTAKNIQAQFKEGSTITLSQDIIRRDMLWVSDEPYNKAVDMIIQFALLCKDQFEIVIIEGITQTSIYEEMFEYLANQFTNVLSYYFEVPFEETMKRHENRLKKYEFGESEMAKWWNNNDLLSSMKEKVINEKMSEQEIITMILHDIKSTKTREK